MMALLDETKKQHEDLARLMGDRWRGEGLIVCNWDGAPLHHDTVSKWFRRFTKKHGFDVTFHQLRHTHATLLFANNIDAVAVASRLGHKDASTTLRVYAHAFACRDFEAAHTFDRIFGDLELPAPPELKLNLRQDPEQDEDDVK